MLTSYIKLVVASILPVLFASVFYILDKKTKFNKLKYIQKQIIYGVAFGILAILGTEFGITLNHAQVNCRDAAVMTAGLLFGGPAGIIAGVIGGIERYISVYWGISRFTQIACSVSTVFAGFFAAGLRKHLLEDKKPGWLFAFAMAFVMEAFHLNMVFITNIRTPLKALEVIEDCTLPMLIANSVSVMLSAISITLLAKEKLINFKKNKQYKISNIIQNRLLVTVIIVFSLSTLFVNSIQSKIAITEVSMVLDTSLDDIVNDINDESDRNIIRINQSIIKELKTKSINEVLNDYDVSEINIINNDGIITDSNITENINFDMSSGEQSKEFLCLLDDKSTYVQKYGPISLDSNKYMKYGAIKTETGFVQIGLNKEQLQKSIGNNLEYIVKNRHIQNTGFAIVLDKDSNIVGYPSGFDQTIKIDINDKLNLGENKIIDINNKAYYSKYTQSEGYYILGIIPEKEVLESRNITLYVNTFLEICVFATLFIIIYFLIKKLIVDRIKKINKSLTKISSGNLNEVVDVNGNEEFASLAKDINSTVDTLKKYIDDAKARIDAELELAKNIQLSALPYAKNAFNKRKDFEIYACMFAAKEVGGDFYDFYLTNEDVINFLIADVSGKGIPAAMFMMRAKAQLESMTKDGLMLDEVFTKGNNALCEGNDAGMFVTAWQGSVDLDSGIMHFANAGHNPPLVKHLDGKFEYLKSKAGFVLAGMEGIKYQIQEYILLPGDIVYLYTDGVTEATNKNNELYSEQRLLEAINSAPLSTMEALCEYIKNDVDKFVDETPQSDDITMLAFKYVGRPKAITYKVENAVLEDIVPITEFVEETLQNLGVPMKELIQINIAIDEVVSNIIKYGYINEKGPIEVRIKPSTDQKGVYITFIDEGIPYNPLTNKDPDVTLSLDERKIGGLGIYMVKKTMTDVKYKYENNKNILTLRKDFTKE